MDEHRFKVSFPEEGSNDYSQAEEYCYVVDERSGKKRRLRFHNYGEIYQIPGLYEHLFYNKLKCKSPQTVCQALEEEIDKSDIDFSDLVVMDIGAGNGIVGEELSRRGARSVVGIDIIEKAAEAAERDRPDVYDDYFVVDLTHIPENVREDLEGKNFNCLSTVAALGFGDIPPLAFAEAFNIIEAPGWIAFNIKDEFMETKNTTGFSSLIKRMLKEGVIELCCNKKYRHRLSIAGKSLYYFVLIGEKKRNIPEEILKEYC